MTIGLVLAAYPLGVYWLLDRVDPLWLIALLGLLSAVRLASVRTLTRTQVMLAAGAIALFCLIAMLDTQLRVLKLYPVAISGIAAAYCLYTLNHPPSAIERFSRALNMPIDNHASIYTRRLTIIWTGFFICNAVAAVYTALATPTRTWALYNGFISYVLIGLILALEYPVRLAYIKRHRGTAR